MSYKLLVLDIDGTLTNNKKEITSHTLKTLEEAQDKGLKIVLATGRPTYGVAPIANKLKLDKYEGYILSYNGGEIINWKTKESIYKAILSKDLLPILYKYADSQNFAIVTYDNNYIITEKPDDKYVQKAAVLNVMTAKKVDNFLAAIKKPVTKCLIAGEEYRLATLEKIMHQELKEEMGVFRSEPYFLELVPKGIDKGKSLSTLLDKIHIKREEVIAIGDGYNDAPMIQFAGLGVAMANAQDVVKNNADYITYSNEEDGVAHVVEKYYLHYK